MFIKNVVTLSCRSVRIFNSEMSNMQKKGYVPLDNVIVTYHTKEECFYYTQQVFLPQDAVFLEDYEDTPPQTKIFGEFN